ncbi:dihydrofolate reductase [Alkaliphilus hydrothermalis]|uniref:Dihydrofolate reductase n=1 Tax=Alkaliphilus hydrothermalis TaxID=1482730 RepID=A0ABS2NL94_9FIRM|nr:dihydrofolate reductase [Alkaliphilus hydrothermalis]MBM7613699.1 dihydrofolate reductase [Alkaliphilus hydrothermalis]
MISLIVAVDKNMGIGKDNKLLAHIKPDLQYFKGITDGAVVVMGYNTYMSLPIRPLPNRKNIVITRKEIALEGATVSHSFDELIEWAQAQQEEIFICGGASIYQQAMPYADRLYITHIFKSFEADTFFPSIGEEWQITDTKAERENIHHEHPHVFCIYQKGKRQAC